jgi:hypothetical protein
MFWFADELADSNLESIRAFKLTKSKKQIYKDEFDFAYTKTKRYFMDDEELIEHKGKILIFDIESFANFFVIGFKLYGEAKYYQWFVGNSSEKLAWILANFCIVGFNSRTYDMIMAHIALQGKSEAELNKASFRIIENELTSYASEKAFGIEINKSINQIDLIEVAPLQGSLKLYAARLNAPRVQELPYEPNSQLSYNEQIQVEDYNCNDLDCTELLLNELAGDLQLRFGLSEQYEVDLRSKSDAQIAETIIKFELQKLTSAKIKVPEIPVGTIYFYKAPSFVRFYSAALNEALNLIKTTPLIVSASGSISLPDELKGIVLEIGKGKYRLGIGGLHSSESSVFYKADENTLLLDRDVASYYPNILLTNHYFPKHLGINFLTVYRSIVTRRLEAKRVKNKIAADGLKIAANGTFGKTGNQYSILYSPDLLLQVTITGQLCLLMLIEMLELYGIEVVSANTDGIVNKVRKDQLATFESIIAKWEEITGFTTEETSYKAIYSRDVNNYIAFKTDSDKVKTKGTYSEKGSARDSHLSRNPELFICNDAVIKFLAENTPVEETIKKSKNIAKFLTVRNVKGGAIKSGKYLGKTVRWYYSTKIKGEIEYKLSGNKVPNSDGAMPCMELPATFPDDINYDYYIARAKEMLADLGVLPHTTSAGLFDFTETI